MPHYTLHTAKSQHYRGSVPSHSQYGYVIRITPPIVTLQHGEDVEGIGWVPHWGGPKRHVQEFFGWYRHKQAALTRCQELNTRNS